MKATVNFSTQMGYTSEPSIKTQGSPEGILRLAMHIASKSNETYTFTIVSDGIVKHYTKDGRLIDLTANYN